MSKSTYTLGQTAIIYVAVMTFGILGGMTINAIKTSATEAATCPAGSYEIGSKDGKPICKLEPTGCPYGDSIPLDSPKCAPPTNPEAYTPWQPEQPAAEPAPVTVTEPQVKGCTE